MTTATIAGSMLSGPAHALGSAFRPFILILSGCDPKVNPETLFNLIDPIVSHNIPIGYAVDVSTPDGQAEASDGYFEVINRMSSNLPGLFELMPDTAGLDDPIAYFLARKAFDIYGRFQKKFTPAANAQPVSLFSPGAGFEDEGLAGVRSSGFRSVYSPGTDAGATKVGYEPNGVLNISGGITADATVSAEVFQASLDRAVEKDDFVFVHLSLENLTGLSPDRAFRQGSELAVAMAQRKALGQIVPSLPRDFHLRMAGENYDRAICLCIDSTVAGQDISESYLDFVSALDKLSISVTNILPGQGPLFSGETGQPDAAPSPNESCRLLDALPLAIGGDGVQGGEVRPKCAALTSAGDKGFQEAFKIGLSTLLDLSQTAGRASGLDESGILRIPAAVTVPGGAGDRPLDIAGKLPGMIGNHRDAIVVIDAQSLSTNSGRDLIFRELSQLASQPWSTFKTLDGFSNTVVPDFNHLELLRESKFDRYLEAHNTNDGTVESKARLMEYAKFAWQYFENETHQRSGFTPATVFRSDDFKSNYEVITMWDVTSHLNGALCAAEMGIIPREDMVERVTRILKNLPTRKIAGLNLPVDEFHFASGAPLSSNYNSCDVGRLLVSLHLLSRVPELTETVTKLVAGWDLEKTVRQGKIMDISRQKMVDGSQTNCSHYAGIGYRLWGVESNSPYSTPDGEGDFDRGIRLLNAVGNIGPIGAEPLLLEEVELGFSRESKILADVLYSAQLAEYRRSGNLVAVSETPLDREPWFTYQGLGVNDADDPWKVFSIIEEARFKTPGFTYANRMLSTKAAMLWGVIRPGAFSEKLVERAVRDTKLADLGFAVGIYQSTDQPTFGYSGMNTNGIILEAIAYAMRGGKPMNVAEF
jgi:hypothetical protein